VGPTYQVQISGMPNKLLTETMMEAILQQACCDSNVIDLTLRTGKPTGTAVVTFSSYEIVERCLTHFQGRQWDPSGTRVGVNINLQPAPGTGHRHKDSAAQGYAAASSGRLPAKAQTSNSYSAKPAFGLSSETPAFIPDVVVPTKGTGLAKDEPEVTVTGAGKVGFRKAGITISSDNSTEVGDSEAEDEQDTLVAVTA
jgi:hypothetical protein